MRSRTTSALTRRTRIRARFSSPWARQKRTEVKVGKELGEGEDFYTPRPHEDLQEKLMKKKIGEAYADKWKVLAHLL